MNFAIRPADLPADYPRIAELLNFALPTPVTGGQLADDDAQLPAGSIKTQIVAVDSTGMPIGYAEVHRYPNTKVGKFYISLVVAPAVRRQGAGAALLSEIERLALGHGASYLSGDVCDQDPTALAFVERRGYQVKRIGVDSALDLATWDGAPFAEVPAQVLASGIRIFPPAPGAERSVYALMEETVVDLPGYEAQAFMSFETWHHAFCKPGGHIIVAADGDRLVGVTILERQADGSYYTPHTSVLRTYRGRQIALALKLAAIAWARSAGARTMTTGNDSLNVPMLAVNRRLGYVPVSTCYEVAKYFRSASVSGSRDG